MPILVNKETGYAENVPDQAAALDTHGIPLVDQEGNTVTVPQQEAAQAIQSGFRQPDQSELESMLKHAELSTPAMQVGTAIEGFANTATFGLPAALTAIHGEEAQKGALERREANPVAYMAGQVAGVLAPTGAGKLMTMAGEKAAEKAALLFGEQALGRVGTQATKMAIENAVFQSGDEVAKMFLADPNQSVGSAAADIGIAGLVGGVLGGGAKGIGELWDITAGKKVADILNAVKNKTSGLPAELKTAADLDLAPEIESALGDNVRAKNAAALLTESNSMAAAKYQKSLEKFNTDIKSAAYEALGKTEQDISKISSSSKFEIGKEVQDNLAKSIQEKVGPIAKQYDELASKFKSAEIAPPTRLEMANQISQTIADDGLLKGQNDSALKIAQDVFANLDKQATAQDLRTYAQNIRNKYPFGSENYQIGKKIANILESGQEATIEAAAGASDVFSQFKATQAEYGKFKNVLQELNDRLHLGKEAKYGPSSFVKNLRSMDPETIVNRLRLKDDVGLQQLLGEQFPEILEVAKKQELDTVIKKSLSSDGELDIKKLFKQLDQVSPELRSQLISEPAQSRLNAIKQLMAKMPSKMNTSGTAKTLDKLWELLPISGAGLAGGMVGGPMGAVAGMLAGLVGKEAPDAVRLAMLKFLSSDMPVNAKAFKAAVSAADAVVKGEQKLTKSALKVFTNHSMPISEPTPKQISEIKKMVADFQKDPGLLLNGDDNAGDHYLPEQTASASAASFRTLQYLTSLKPDEEPTAPLNMAPVTNAVQEAKYNNAIKIAQSPLLVLQQIQKGTLTSESVQHLGAMYPDLLQKMQNKVGEMLVETADKKDTIPYHTKMCVSLFMGQPLESSMMPNAIMANQQSPAQQEAPQGPNSKIRVSNKLGQVAHSYATPQQSREAARNK